MARKARVTNPVKTARQKAQEDSQQLDLNLDDIKKQHSEVDTQSYTEDEIVPTGSTMLNLACSDFSSGGWKLGSINTLPGQSDSGKTVLCLSGLAKSATLKRLAKYDLVMNNAETKGSFNLKKMFPPLVGRLKEPEGGPSKTINQLGGSIIAQHKTGRPFIQIVDSLDTLKGDSDFEKSTKDALKVAKGDLTAIKELKKSYNAEKAKTIRKILGECNDLISGSDSMLLIVQQVTANMKMKNKFDDPWTSNGGTAPFFNSTHCYRLLQGGKIKDPVHGLEIGNVARMNCLKNHLSGKKRQVSFNVYQQHGIDNIESVCLFLCSTPMWQASAKKVAPETTIRTNEFGEHKFAKLLEILWEDPAKNMKVLEKIAEEAWADRERSLDTGRRAFF